MEIFGSEFVCQRIEVDEKVDRKGMRYLLEVQNSLKGNYVTMKK